MNIAKISAIEILDSRGNPTVETYVELEDGTIGKASVPSGASTGAHEKVELRDGDETHYEGRGTLKAESHVDKEINEALKGIAIENLSDIDSSIIKLDGTIDKSRLGANAILSVSLACARTLSLYKKEPLWKIINESYFPDSKAHFPKLMVNIVNGGAHANWNFDIQEFMIIPQSDSPSSAVETADEVFHTLGELLKQSGLPLHHPARVEPRVGHDPQV